MYMANALPPAPRGRQGERPCRGGDLQVKRSDTSMAARAWQINLTSWRRPWDVCVREGGRMTRQFSTTPRRGDKAVVAVMAMVGALALNASTAHAAGIVTHAWMALDAKDRVTTPDLTRF